MKKLLLLSAFSAVAAFNASAQSEIKTSPKGRTTLGNDQTSVTTTTGTLTTAKTTATAPREYSHFDYNATISSFDTTGGADFSVVRIWADSTITQSFSSGAGAVNYSSVAQVIYPMDSIFNDPSNPNNLGLMKVTSANTYNIDSVKVSGLYITGSTKSSSVVDTLVISLTSQPSNISFYYARLVWLGYGVDFSPYLTTADNDTLRAIAPLSVDSINRAALAYGTTPARAFWKVPLTAAMRSPSATAPIVTWAFAPPSGSYAIPAGSIPAVTFTFKSGDTWVANVDNIDSFHRFLPLFGGTANIMPYKGKFHAAINDRSSSSLLFSTSPGFGYSPSVEIEAENSIAFDFEYLAASFVVSCPTCGLVTLGIKELTNVSDVKVFPNPSNEKVNISFTAKERASFTVSITNTLGQVVANQDMGMQNAGQTANVSINTSNLPTGIYMYTIESNGQRMTDRLSIAH
jgi:hypothetical protein